jgi:hypothetical protein
MPIWGSGITSRPLSGWSAVTKRSRESCRCSRRILISIPSAATHVLRTCFAVSALTGSIHRLFELTPNAERQSPTQTPSTQKLRRVRPSFVLKRADLRSRQRPGAGSTPQAVTNSLDCIPLGSHFSPIAYLQVYVFASNAARSIVYLQVYDSRSKNHRPQRNYCFKIAGYPAKYTA